MTDQEAKAWFGRSVEQCMDSLYGLALRLTRNSADAEDLVADAVTRAWSAIATLEDRARFRPWLFRILHNGYISDYRKRSVRPAEWSVDELAAEGEEDDVTLLLIEQSDDFLNWWANPEREFANRVLGQDIMAAIDELPDVFRSVISLVTVEGMSYDDAAEILGVPPGTVRSRMKRGRTLLQKSLWQHGRDAGLITGEEAQGCRL